MRRTTLARRAQEWNALLEKLTRPLAPTEAAMLEKARTKLLAKPLPGLLRAERVQDAFSSSAFQFRVKTDPLADTIDDFGICTNLSTSPLELDDAHLRIMLVQAASAFAVRDVMAARLGFGFDPGMIDYFAEAFQEHGHVTGRAIQLAGGMLGRCNAELFERSLSPESLGRDTTEDKVRVPVPFILEDFFQEASAQGYRTDVYEIPVADPKASFRAEYGSRYSEERVWRFFFDAIGVRYYEREAPGRMERKLRSVARKVSAPLHTT